MKLKHVSNITARNQMRFNSMKDDTEFTKPFFLVAVHKVFQVKFQGAGQAYFIY